MVELTQSELAALQYAISELLAKTDEWEFPILVGMSVASARTLRDELRELSKSESDSQA